METNLTQKEVDLLLAALDAYKYWELSDEDHRRDGFALEPEEGEASYEAFQEVEALSDKLTKGMME